MSGIKITAACMSSPATPHTARASGDGWEVSWLPGRTLTRNQAITAMVIANIVGDRGVGLAGDPIWPHLDSWAGEMGLSGADAVARVSEPPTPDGPAPQEERTTEPLSGGARLCAHADRDSQGAHCEGRVAPDSIYEACRASGRGPVVSSRNAASAASRASSGPAGYRSVPEAAAGWGTW